MRTSFILWIAISWPHFLFAGWVDQGRAPFTIERSDADIQIAEDGKVVEVVETEMKALNDEGRSRLALYSQVFSPAAGQTSFVSGSSLTDGVSTPVDQRAIQIRAAAGAKEGKSDLREMIIPFTNLKVGSIIKFKLLIKKDRVLVPGLYSDSFVYGLHAPEIKGVVTIKSPWPISVSFFDPEHVLQFESAREGANGYRQIIRQTKPLFKVPDDVMPTFTKESITYVRVSTMQRWDELAKSLTGRYEKILGQKLPPSMERIRAQAASAKDVFAKIDVVTSELSTVMTYAGDWTSFDKGYFPKTLDEIGGSKTGDCKDFATATAAILRSLGLDARVALTYRKNFADPMWKINTDPELLTSVSSHAFNHAIVAIDQNGKTLWLDPTNVVHHSEWVGADIGGSPALVLSKSTSGLATIEKSGAGHHNMKITRDVRFGAGSMAEVSTTMNLEGEYASTAIEQGISKGDEAARDLVIALAGFDPKKATKTEHQIEGLDFKSRVATGLNLKITSLNQKLIFEDNADEIKAAPGGHPEAPKKYFISPISARLQIYRMIQDNRVTGLRLGSPAKEEAVTTVSGYDFAKDQVGCRILTPWFSMNRQLVKIDKGFEIRDRFEILKPYLSPDVVNGNNFQFSIDDIGDCKAAQAIEVAPLDSSSTLQARLKDYTFEKIKAGNDSSGPKSIQNARISLHMAEQLIASGTSDKDIELERVRSFRRVGYKRNDIDNSSYEAASDDALKVLLEKYPTDGRVLIQKAYSQLVSKDVPGATKTFAQVFSAFPTPNYDVFMLGGSLAEEMKNWTVAASSYRKALSLAQTDLQKHKASFSIADMLIELKDLEGADGYYRSAIRLNPENTWLQGNYMSFLFDQKKWDEAIKEGEEMLRIASYGVGKSLLAKAYAGKAAQMASTAELYFSQSLDPEGSAMKDVEKTCSKALDLDPRNGQCLNMLGDLYGVASLHPTSGRKYANLSANYYERCVKDCEPGGYKQAAQVKLGDPNFPVGAKRVRSPAEKSK